MRKSAIKAAGVIVVVAKLVKQFLFPFLSPLKAKNKTES